MKGDYSLTPEEVADILKIKKNTVYELVKRGEIPAYRVGRKIRIEFEDVEAYKERSKGVKKESIFASSISEMQKPLQEAKDVLSLPKQGIVICGLDILLDILTRHIENASEGISVYRNHVGSFPGLMALYTGKADMAGIHLWDSDSGTYNVPYIRRLLPGIPAIIVHLAIRTQGFYVQTGNPLKITAWQDLERPGLRIINREPGCGTRVLLDEKIRLLGLNRLNINGYSNEEYSHLAVASAVARGVADVALGNQKAAMQVRDIDFIPLQKERYELVMKEEDVPKPASQLVLNILNSHGFKEELEGVGDYELAETGRIVARV